MRQVFLLTVALPCLLFANGEGLEPKEEASAQIATAVEPEFSFDFGSDHSQTEKTVVEPKDRAEDFEEAFKALKRANPDAKIYAIVEGQSVEDVVDLQVMPNGTLLVLTIRYGRQEETRVVKVEEVDYLGHRGFKRESPIRYPDGW